MSRAGQAAVSAGLTLDASMARTTAVYRELLAASFPSYERRSGGRNGGGTRRRGD